MSDRRIRTAFEHLQDDVATNVPTAGRLARILKESRRLPRASLAFLGGAAVVLVAGAIVFLLRPGGQSVPPVAETASTSSTASTSTTSASTTTEVGATSLPDLLPGMVLVANPSLDSDVVTSGPATVGVAADRAVSDGKGGFFVQRGNTVSWVHANASAESLLSLEDLGAIDPTGLRLEGATRNTFGTTNSLVLIIAGGEGEQRYEEVWFYDVDARSSRKGVYHTGAYEGSISRASVERGVLVVTRRAEGFTWFEFYTAAGRPLDVKNPKSMDETLPVYVDQGVLSPDGTTLVFLESNFAASVDGGWPMDLVVWNLADGTKTRRVSFDLGDWTVDHMDYDGLNFVVGRQRWRTDGLEDGAPLLGTLDEDVQGPTELDLSGWPSLVRDDGK